MSENPLFERWTTPFGLPPFDRIRPDHFPPAFDHEMEVNVAEMEAVAANPEPPTFANTIEAMERCGKTLGRITSVFYNLLSSNGNDALEAIAREYAPKFAQHYSRLSLDPRIFARVDAVHARRDELDLTVAERRLLDRAHLHFVRMGALLDEHAKERMKAIYERLSSLHTLFGQNVLHDEKSWTLVLEATDLDGLPAFLVDAAARAAQERELDGRYVITLARSSVEPFLTFSARRDLRREAFEAWSRRGEHDGEQDNRPLIREILALRAEQARLLGYATYADYSLDDSMAKTTDAVAGLLHKVWEPAKRKAAAERDQLAEMARTEGMNEAIQPWDWRYYAEKVRKAKYDLDEAEVKPYFVLENMVDALFDTAGRLFGLEFVERPDLPRYHPDVKAYEVTDKADGRHVGIFLHDNHARPTKRSGAWMSSYRDQENLDEPVTPIIVNNNNFARGEPTLLSFDDAETLFHEFGHGLHGLLSQVRYPTQSGTSVLHDFVEFPSQVLEHWMSAPETLRRYARHFQTGEPIPDELISRLLAARNFNQGFATVEYTACALIDQEFHKLAEVGDLDVAAFEREMLERIGMPAEITMRHRPTQFQHLFAGSSYASGYYAYLWAEVLDADGYEAFVEKGDLFDPVLAAGLKAIYSSGGSRDPMEMYRDFRGGEPRIEALLKHRGLEEAA